MTVLMRGLARRSFNSSFRITTSSVELRGSVVSRNAGTAENAFFLQYLSLVFSSHAGLFLILKTILSIYTTFTNSPVIRATTECLSWEQFYFPKMLLFPCSRYHVSTFFVGLGKLNCNCTQCYQSGKRRQNE